jgi:hypothetical protein
MSMMGDALGTTAAAPGTNSSGTALSSEGVGGPMLDNKAAIDPEDAKINKMINSIAGDVDASGPGVANYLKERQIA